MSAVTAGQRAVRAISTRSSSREVKLDGVIILLSFTTRGTVDGSVEPAIRLRREGVGLPQEFCISADTLVGKELINSLKNAGIIGGEA